MDMLIPVIVVARCGGDHYIARIWTVVAGVISGGQSMFGLIYQYLLGLWRCASAALCWKQVSTRRLTFRSLMCRALAERAAKNKILTCLRAYHFGLSCAVSQQSKPVKCSTSVSRRIDGPLNHLELEARFNGHISKDDRFIDTKSQ